MQKIFGFLKNLTTATKGEIRENKPVFVLIIFASFIVVSLISAPVFISNETKAEERSVLGSETQAKEEEPSPTPTITPTPTTTPLVRVIATPIPTLTVLPTVTPTPTVNQNNNNNSNNTNPTPTPTTTVVTPTSTPTLTPTPTEAPKSEVTININYSGQKENDFYTVEIEEGQKAWEVIKEAIGEANLTYTDYGGDLGIFITGFNGVAAAGNQFYEFKVNGESSMIGVSVYVCSPGDNLEFVLTTF